MKHPINKSSKAVACAVIAIATGASAPLLQAGDAPWISPNYDYVIGVNKTLDVYCGGGSSDEPDYAAPCPPWSLSSGTEVWNWTLGGPGSKSGDEDQITVTATGVGSISVSVNRNDTYSDETQPDPTTDSGVVSPDSETLSILAVEVKEQDSSKKWFYFGNPSSPIPTDVEQHLFYVDGGYPPQGSRYDWSASISTFQDHYPGNCGQLVKAKSSGSGNVDVEANWGSEGLGVVSLAIRTAEWNGNGLSSAVWFNDGWSMGWDQYNSFSIKDSEGDLIEENIGLNEQFLNRNNSTSGNNWPTPNQVNASTETGGGVDHYGIKQRIIAITLDPVPSENNGQAVFSITQKYRIGSSSSGDGQLINEHTLTYHRGYVSIQ